MPLISGVFYAALVVFLFFYIRSIDFDSLAHTHFNWQLVVVASVFGLGMRIWQIVVWFIILQGLGAQNMARHWVQLSYVYAKSWLARYIPGTAPWILGKIYFASKHGVSKSKLAVSSLLEASLQVVVILAMSLLILSADSRFDVVDSKIRLAMTVLLVGCIAVIVPFIFNRVLGAAFRVLRGRVLADEHRVNTAVIAKGVIMYAIGGILYGTFLFFMAKAVFPELPFSNLVFVIGAGNLAGALGILSIFAPSGLGVRDGIQLLLFSVIMPPEFALVITVLTRLWDIVLDLVFYVLAWLLRLWKPGE